MSRNDIQSIQFRHTLIFLALSGQTFSNDVIIDVSLPTQVAPTWAKSWHQWGLFNLALMNHFNERHEPVAARRHVAPAVQGFFCSVALGQENGACENGRVIPDLLDSQQPGNLSIASRVLSQEV